MNKRDPNPILEVKSTVARAEKAGIELFNGMSLSTTGRGGKPSTRIVLLKDVDERGFVFYTNLKSRKAAEIAANPNVSLCFWWSHLQEQICIEGVAEAVSDEEADEYFATRPRGSQLSAWASQQSEPMASSEILESAMEEYARRFEGKPIPRPSHWSGLRVVPDRIEFWYGRADRLHERYLYSRTGSGGWEITRLQP